MKRYLKLVFSVGLTFCLMLSLCFTSFADLKSLMIATNSNALMTMNLTDDYGIMTVSSIPSAVNTVNWSDRAMVRFYMTNDVNGKYLNYYRSPTEILDNGYNIKFTAPEGYTIQRIYFYWIYYGDYACSPPPGTYDMSFWARSQFDYAPTSADIRSQRQIDNATTLSETSSALSFSCVAGDLYIGDQNITITSGLRNAGISFLFPLSLGVKNVDYTVSMEFTSASVSEDNISTVKTTISSEDSTNQYQDNVSSSLSDLSSSVDTMTDEISGVTEAIQSLQGAMEPHYSNVLAQLHHITEQLHAFYDQIYNNIHLKEYALWQDIKTAIENIDLEVNVNLDKLKTSIDNMSTAIQNKLQSVQEAITNGFDNQGINQDAAELDQSLQEYEEAEQTVLDQVNDSLDDFEFDSGFDEYKTTISVFSDFLQDLYDSSGGFKVVINLSLMLSIAGIVIGVYRFRDGG